MSSNVTSPLLSELAPKGYLRAGINVSNFLLVTGRDNAGNPVGVAPDMARALAERLGVDVRLIPFATPGELADQAGQDVWDIGIIGAEPQRAQHIAFSPAYVEIAATYLVPAGSSLQRVDDVDRAGTRIATTRRTAYTLWLERNIKHAELVTTADLDSAYDTFVSQKLDALAGLRPRLLEDVQKLPGARLLDGQFSAVQQAIGTARANEEGARFIRQFVEEAKQDGRVASLIEKHRVRGLTVAPPAP